MKNNKSDRKANVECGCTLYGTETFNKSYNTTKVSLQMGHMMHTW